MTRDGLLKTVRLVAEIIGIAIAVGTLVTLVASKADAGDVDKVKDNIHRIEVDHAQFRGHIDQALIQLNDLHTWVLEHDEREHKKK